MKITRTQQPQGAEGIDWANPITEGLTVSLPLNSNNFQSLGLNKVVGTPLNASQGVSKAGTHLKLAGTGYVSLGTTCLLPSASTPFTLTLYELPSSVTTYSSLLALSGGTQQWLWIRGSHISYLCAIGRSSSGVLNFNSVGAPVVGVGRRFVITSQNGIEGTNTGYRLWMDGVEQTSEPTNFGSIASSTNYIGWDSGAEDKWNGGLQDFNLWSRVLSDAEIASYFRNPWQLFSKINRPIFVGVGAGSGDTYTLTAEAGAFTIAGTDATLTYTSSGPTYTVTADAGAIAIAGNAATLDFNRALTAETANVAITGNAASLVFTPVGGPTYTLPADSAAVAISGAATSLVRGYNLTASAGAVSISASDAALMATRKLIADAYAAVIAGADATLTYTPAVLPTIGRPASDTSNSGWTASTGTDLFAMVDEVTPDALDYIVTTATGSVCELALDTTAYPGTASQALKYRASSSTGNSLIVRLKNGATTIRTETQALTASDTEYTITLTSGEIAAITSGSLSVELESA